MGSLATKTMPFLLMSKSAAPPNGGTGDSREECPANTFLNGATTMALIPWLFFNVVYQIVLLFSVTYASHCLTNSFE